MSNSFYDDASLVVIPSGYKTSKVYAEKPTDGSGDLAFTRTGDTATRVNSAGLIEKVRTNLVLNSATFVTQTIAVGANPHTLSFTGTGTIVATGVGSGTLVGTGASNRVSLSFTTTAGNLILTLTGTATLAQLETGDIATAYIPTTAAAVSVGPVANVPRLDYLGSTCGKLLLEPQRTNLALYSEQFDNAAWDETGVSVTANNTTSPDGTQNADKIIEDSSNGIHLFYNLNPIVGAATSTASIFYKKGTRRYFSIKLQIGSNSYTQVYDAEGVTTGANSSNGLTSVSTSIVSMGNGWIRATLTGTDPLGLTATYMIVSLSNSATPTFDPSNKNPTYQGTGTDNGFVWGAQLEAGAYATSYIPTLAASATRGADACSKTGISSLIGQTQGTLFVDMNYTNTNNSEDATPFRVLGSGSAQMYVEINTNETFEAVVVNSAGTLVFNSTSAVQVAGRKKLAIAYKGSDFAYYINGTQISVQTSGAFASASLDSLNLGMYASGVQVLADTINQTLLFTTRLTNSELAELTSL